MFIIILISNCVVNFAIDTNKLGSYFYTSSYEGFAGYCTVITEELSDVSKKMRKVLNIAESPRDIELLTVHQDKTSQTIPLHSTTSKTTSFSQHVSSVNKTRNTSLSTENIPNDNVNFSTLITNINIKKI